MMKKLIIPLFFVLCFWGAPQVGDFIINLKCIGKNVVFLEGYKQSVPYSEVEGRFSDMQPSDDYTHEGNIRTTVETGILGYTLKSDTVSSQYMRYR